MNIRLATSGDYFAIMSLMKQLNPKDSDISNGKGMQIFKSILNTEGLAIYLAELDGIPAACCYLNIIPNLTRGGRPYAVIENVITDTNFQRQGVGTLLLKEVIATAFRSECYKVMLLTGRDRKVHKFYKNCGLEKDKKTAFIKRSADAK